MILFFDFDFDVTFGSALLFCVAPMLWSTWWLIGVEESSGSSSSSSQRLSLDSHRLFLKTDAGAINVLVDEWLATIILVPSFLISFISFHSWISSLRNFIVTIIRGAEEGCTTKRSRIESEKGVEKVLEEVRRRPACWCVYYLYSFLNII